MSLFAVKQSSSVIFFLLCLCMPPLLFRRLPPQENYLSNTTLTFRNWFHASKQWFFIFRFHSHLAYIFLHTPQCFIAVKLHRVFTSYCAYSASSRKFQFRYVYCQDSGIVVTPFMLDRNYRPRNFATLLQSWLPLPFTRTYHIHYIDVASSYWHWAGVSLFTSSS